MKKINKYYNTAFTVRENKNGTRNLMQSGEPIPSIIASKFKGDILCSTTFKQSEISEYQAYVTKNNMVVTGDVKMDYTITDPMAYANERYTYHILDVIVRTVISEYISMLDLSGEDQIHLMSDEDQKACINYINYVLKKALPWVKLDNISKILIGNYEYSLPSNVRKFNYVNYVDIEEDKDKVSEEAEYYKPFIWDIADNVGWFKSYYPKYRFVAHDNCLYYNCRAKYYGKYRNEKAKGNIVNIGRHVYGPEPVLFSKSRLGVNENLFTIYPVIIYDVTDLRLYISHYDFEIKDLLAKLSKEVIRHEARETDIITNIKDLSNMGNTKTLRDLHNYGVYPKLMVYILKNPFVREDKYIKAPAESQGAKARERRNIK